MTAPTAPATTPARWWAATFAGTPGRLRQFGAVTIVGCLLFAAAGFAAVSARAAALADARAQSTQLVRLETIRTSLLTADANATNAFLVGGLEPATTRAAYDTGIDTASTTIAAAAGADVRDAAALDVVNADLARYVGLVETARANNRQGFPIGAAYLRQATTGLRASGGALERLASMAGTVQGRVDVAVSSSSTAGVALDVVSIVALVALVVAQLWVSRRTRRWINRPMALATLVVVVVGVAAFAFMTSAQSTLDSTRSGSYAATVSAARARIAAFEAKSDESLTLIARGSGAADEQEFRTLAGTATAALRQGSDDSLVPSTRDSRTAGQAFATYLAVHTTIRNKDDNGDWDGAVALATGTTSGSANAAFAAFDRASRAALDSWAGQVDRDLHDARAALPVVRWLVALAGLVAAVLCWRGVAIRLREYR